MADDQQSLTSVQTPSIDDIASLASLLQDAEIPSALWGVNAAGCYGGGLCPLVRRHTQKVMVTHSGTGYRDRHQ